MTRCKCDRLRVVPSGSLVSMSHFHEHIVKVVYFVRKLTRVKIIDRFSRVLAF